MEQTIESLRDENESLRHQGGKDAAEITRLTVEVDRLKLMLDTVATQRNMALDTCAQLNASLVEAQSQLSKRSPIRV